MSTEWYLHKDGSQYGPYSWDEMLSFAREGRIASYDSVWNTEMSSWSQAGNINGLLDIQDSFENPAKNMETPGRWAVGEDLLGIIPEISKKTGLLSSKTYTLLVTEKRMIFAVLTGKALKDAAAEAAEDSKGKGFLTRMKETATSRQRIYRRYTQMSPDEVLRENPENFFIDNSEVVSIKIRREHYFEDSYGQRQQNNDEMTIRTSREKIKLVFQSNSGTGNARKILWRAVGNKVK